MKTTSTVSSPEKASSLLGAFSYDNSVVEEVDRVLRIMEEEKESTVATPIDSPQFIHKGRALLLQLPADADDRLTEEVHYRRSSVTLSTVSQYPMDQLLYYIREIKGKQKAREYVQFFNSRQRTSKNRPTRTSVCIELLAQVLRSLPAHPALAENLPVTAKNLTFSEALKKYRDSGLPPASAKASVRRNK